MVITVSPIMGILIYIAAIILGIGIGFLCAFATQIQNIRFRKQYQFPKGIPKMETKGLHTTGQLEDDYIKPVK